MYYDSRNEQDFKVIFWQYKNAKYGDFLVKICSSIRIQNSYIDVPSKEVDLLLFIENVLNINNKFQDMNALTQLLKEIEIRKRGL